ncbi:uncharacterized protein ColSpa_02979 [Colletotrichum spaethianum]|uniref:Uncharacterized protein n=1 Tax=Colletotrichum spaethianum TaxID=700344 RepID=A0AA37LAL4_9PEZI|nr:uncharacterized protein ColSpa_02979 [Colletotrichum spaethianum]GKT42798.1 hypothetical protein ColSpa_02979 [Colletotrichum spaethianum]
MSSVYQVAEGDIAEKLESLGLKTRVGVKTNGTWHNTWREDSSDTISYAYVFNNAASAIGELVVHCSGVPYCFDARRRAKELVLHYKTEVSTTNIPLSLASNQTKLIGFADSCLEDVATPDIHFTELPGNI